MAIGAGMYTLGIISTVMILIAQIILHLNIGHNRQPKIKMLIIKDVKIPDYQEYIKEMFTSMGIVIQDVVIDKNFDSSSF